jgi:trehalose 6-phosphate phosphatase
VTRLRGELGAAAVVYLGDDLTDEDVFGRLGPADVGVKVGEGETRARHRVADPDAALAVLRLLGDLLA